jgi:hypothetical protein
LKVGVSSRGLGSVEQRGGMLYVGNDFELICWDAVTQPSTPNAWICTDEREIELYKESVKTEKNVISETNDKFAKFNNWLND